MASSSRAQTRAGGARGQRVPSRLRPGVNDSPRAQVSDVQRARMLSAAVQVVAEQGYGGMSIARVTSRAGVSRRTFYDMFADRQDCFLAAFEDGIARAGNAAGTAYAQARGGWREQVRAGLSALLELFDDEPALGSLLVVDALGAGLPVLRRRAQALGALTRIVDKGSRRSGAQAKGGRVSPPPLPSPLVAEGAVGAVFSMIHARMSQQRPGDRPRRRLSGLLNELMAMIVLPYLGRAVAQRELRHSGPKTPPAPRGSAIDPLDGLRIRLTYRTLRVLGAIGEPYRRESNPSNREVADAAGVADQGQISKLLARLERLGLIENMGPGQPYGERNAWRLTTLGEGVWQKVLIERPDRARIRANGTREVSR